MEEEEKEEEKEGEEEEEKEGEEDEEKEGEEGELSLLVAEVKLKSVMK